jgi:DNA damage-binding protein 1
LLQISPTPISKEGLRSLAIPSDIKTVSLDSLLSTPLKKGKAKATGDEMDLDDEDEDVDSVSSCGQVVSPTGSFITVLETYKNIAPIMDAIWVDPDKSGQYQFVTCSGGANTGSLNVIRNGTDFKELGFAPGMGDTTRVWSVKSMTNDE